MTSVSWARRAAYWTACPGIKEPACGRARVTGTRSGQGDGHAVPEPRLDSAAAPTSRLDAAWYCSAAGGSVVTVAGRSGRA
jgi:hypothetical protein